MKRKRIFEVIEVAAEGDRLSDVYDSLMLITIVISIIPLAFKETFPFFTVTDRIATVLFIGDYLLRWITADYKLKKRASSSFVRYPFTPWAIIDLLSILPSLTLLNSGFKLLRLFRIFRTARVLRALRVVRIFKAMRYSKSLEIVIRVMKNSQDALMAVMTLAVSYVLICSLVIFNAEPDSFETFFEAIYWAVISLTTVGYGDIYPVTTVGRIVTMVSSLFGIAIVALPAGIITAGYMKEIEERNKQEEETVIVEIEK